MTGFMKFVILGVLSAVVGVSFSAPTPAPNPLRITLQLYRSLNLEMRALRVIEKQAYDSYKQSRFDPDMYIPHYNIDGMPSLNNISNADRFFMSEMDILKLHSSNLRAFQQLMFFVKMDENMSNQVPDFGPQFAVIGARLARVEAGILAVMAHLNFLQHGLPETVLASMGPQSNAALRNIRDLYVLQEMYSYIAIAEYDLNRRMAVHQTQAAADQ